MRTIGGGKGGWLAGMSVLFWAGACAAPQDSGTDSATSAMAMAAPTAPVTDYGHCGGTNQPDCHGGLQGLPTDWAGTGQLPRQLPNAIGQRFANVNFAEGSQVAMPRKSKSGGLVWTRVDAIDDAHTVFPGEIQYPVIMARFAVIRGTGEDNRMGVSNDPEGIKSYYFVVNPDSWNGDTPGKSSWAVVEYNRASSRARIVAENQEFAPCKDSNGQNHPQKPAPFAWFVSCPVANMSFETVMGWKGAIAADSSRGASILSTLPPDLQAALRLTGDNDDPLWITCGLGCCSTEG